MLLFLSPASGDNRRYNKLHRLVCSSSLSSSIFYLCAKSIFRYAFYFYSKKEGFMKMK